MSTKKTKGYSKVTIANYVGTLKAVFDAIKNGKLYVRKNARNFFPTSLTPLKIAYDLNIFTSSPAGLIQLADKSMTSQKAVELVTARLMEAKPLIDRPSKHVRLLGGRNKKASKKIVHTHVSTLANYAKLIEDLRKKAKTSIHINAMTFAKDNKVSTNLLLALVNKKYLTRTGRGKTAQYVWSGSTTLSGLVIAKRITKYLAKYLAKSVSKRKSVVFKNAVNESGSLVVRPIRKDVPTNKGKTPRRGVTHREPSSKTLPSASDARTLAKMWTDLGEYATAINVLQKIKG
jgi:hypothetical protein